MNRDTNLISIISTEHGRMRREERDISKRDLQRALKYGNGRRGWKGRWLFEYDGITFVTNPERTTEITAYPSPLALAPLTTDQRVECAKAKQVLKCKPNLIASHTVLVMDNSGSMTQKDIPVRRCRQNAAYSETALEFVAEQLLKGTANNSDVVTLIEFSNKATVVFETEPVSWVLYNKILDRRDSRSFSTPQDELFRDTWHADSNYLPALDKTFDLLKKYEHAHSALAVFFLSDGQPTDAKQLNILRAAAEKRIVKAVEKIACEFGERLHFFAAGFASTLNDFSVLQSMVTAVQDTKTAGATFMHCRKLYSAVGSAVSSLVQSTTLTRTALQGGRRGASRTSRGISAETSNARTTQWSFYYIEDHLVFNPKTKQFCSEPGMPPGAITLDNAASAEARKEDPPPFLALNRHHCGEGAERVAFRCYLADAEAEDSFIFEPMVAKETNMVERIEENDKFHRSFCETQGLAAWLAEEFNRRVVGLEGYNPMSTPKITFLPCSVLILEDHQWPGGRRPVLVEKKLDVDRYTWYKWNDNNGYVNGIAFHPAIDVDLELKRIRLEDNNGLLEEIEECDSEAEGDESESDEGSNESDDRHRESAFAQSYDPQASNEYKPEDYLQAFTHFTYRFTDRKVLVCDLQGIFRDDSAPPHFELTDPAVHYRSNNGRKKVFGRTDLGQAGIDSFFRTHRCSGICKMMSLSGKNRSWKKDWKETKGGRSSNFQRYRRHKKR